MTEYYEGTIQGDTPVTEAYLIVTVASTKKVTKANAGAGNGVIVNLGPSGGTAGEPCLVVKSGRCKIKAGATITIDDELTSETTTARATPASSGNVVVAVALSPGTDGQLVDAVVSASKPQSGAAP